MPPGRNMSVASANRVRLRSWVRWWMAKPGHHDVEHAELRQCVAEVVGDDVDAGLVDEAGRARSIIGGELSNPTASRTSGRAVSTTAMSRPSPQPRSSDPVDDARQRLDQLAFARSPSRQAPDAFDVLIDLVDVTPRRPRRFPLHRHSMTQLAAGRSASRSNRPSSYAGRTACGRLRRVTWW